MKPKLREIEAHPIQHQGQAMILLRDPLQLSDELLAIPRPLGPLLALMDGSRDEGALEAALLLRAGVRLAPGLLGQLLDDLDEAYMLENERFAGALAAALRDYREAPHRSVTLDGSSFAGDPEQAAAQLQAYVDALPPESTGGPPESTGGPPESTGGPPESTGGPPESASAQQKTIRGVVSPHIDYQRGGPVYAQVWQAAAGAAREAELVILLGTDHQGSDGAVTLTRQSYATPWGVLPTDGPLVEALAEALGEETVFAEELHHRGEHSIELAAVWLHFVRGGQAVPLVPILLGSFAAFVGGQGNPGEHGPFAAVLAVLREAMADRRTLVVAAADLAHMGPAFGDPRGLDFVAQAQLRNADERLLQAVYAGDAGGFFQQLKAEGDRRHVCGLPPIYLTLRLLEETSGEPAGYALCPADPQGMSFVSIAGVTLS